MIKSATKSKYLDDRLFYYQTAWNTLASMKMWDAIDYMENLPVMDETNDKGLRVREMCEDCKRTYTNKETLVAKRYKHLNSFFLDFQDNVDDVMHNYVEELNLQIYNKMSECGYEYAQEKSMAMTAYILLDASYNYYCGIMGKEKQRTGKDYMKTYHMYNVFSVREKWWEVMEIFIRNDACIAYAEDEKCFQALRNIEKYLIDGQNMKEIIAVTALNNKECNTECPNIIKKIKEWKKE